MSGAPSPATAIGRLRRALARGAFEARALAGGRRYRRFVIVGIARTGSTVLVSLLNAHSEARCFGELFRAPDAIGWDVRPWAERDDPRLLALYRRDPVAFLERAVWRRWPAGVKAVGFKLFYYHARAAPFSAVWTRLRDDADVAVIHIKRRNILAQYLSLERARRTDVWSATAPARDAAAPIRLDADACARHFAEVRAYEAEADRFFAAHDRLEVAYEDLAADRARETARIGSFLGLRPETLDTRLVRQRTTPLTEAVANHAELAARFAGTEWAAFFEPEAAGA